MCIWLLLISLGVIAFSGFPALLMNRRSAAGQHIATVLNVVGSSVAAAAIVLHWLEPGISPSMYLSWSLPIGGFAVELDDLSLVFLLPIFLISALGSAYGLSYWRQREHISSGTRLSFCWGLITAAMAMVVLSRSSVLFLMAWEVMALSAFFLIATEEETAQVRQAAWVYLIATHLGTVCLIAFFVLLRSVTGSFDLWPTLPAGLTPDAATALFILGTVGFGLKAGIMPLHVWLPGAHANAPSHVSAILSGVMLKMGVYGIVRVSALMPHPPVWWGATLLVAGTLSAGLGISFAMGQRDIKRLLAYSSIENVGIIVLGIGLATLGRSMHRPEWVVLGLGGALLHVLNHSLFKPLLFMGAGSILHATGTRQMDLLGGLGQRMPRTLILMLIGAVAICGLPPLNGFVSELFLYLGLFKSVLATSSRLGWVGLTAPALAMVGAIAVAAFVGLLGAVFAGNARSKHAEHAHDPEPAMLRSMWILAGLCLVTGLFPGRTVGMLDRAIAVWAPIQLQPIGSVAGYVPIGWLTAIALAVVALVTLTGLWFFRWRIAPATSGLTWDCGYSRPTARMEYTGSAFSQMMIELLDWVLWPRRQISAIKGVFAGDAHFSSEVPDVVLDRAILPVTGSAEGFFGSARIFQRGPIQVYLLYILGILVLLLMFA